MNEAIPTACPACGAAAEEELAACWACGTLLETPPELEWSVEYKGVELVLPARWREVTRDDVLCRWQSTAAPESVVLTVLEPEDPKDVDLAEVARNLAEGVLADADRSTVQLVEGAFGGRHVVDAVGFSAARQTALAARVVACPSAVAVVLHALELSAAGAPPISVLAIDPSLEEHRQGILRSVLVVDGE